MSKSHLARDLKRQKMIKKYAAKRAELKAAGDYELDVNGDVRAALDYYQQWIQLANESMRSEYDQSDTWLLASLKRDR